MSEYRILITGGSGFIGTNLIDSFLKEGNTVLSLDRSEPKVESHRQVFRKLDLLDYDNLERCILSFNPNFVVHLGARTDLNGVELTDYDANVLGVHNLLNVLDKLSSINRVLFASSMYVCQPGYTPKNFDDYKPHTIYGESKVLTEKIIKERNPSYSWSIIRPTSIWGPYFGEPYDLFFKIVLSRRYFHMGSKACKKTYGYIGNFIYQLKSVLFSNLEEVDKRVFYLGDYEPYDISTWADEIANEKNIHIPSVPYYFFVILGYLGDFFKLIGIKFPMTSFRLRNMTTDNIYNLDEIRAIAPKLPFSRIEGTKITITWLEK